jgi:hypothetical protein
MTTTSINLRSLHGNKPTAEDLLVTGSAVVQSVGFLSSSDAAIPQASVLSYVSFLGGGAINFAAEEVRDFLVESAQELIPH